MLHHRLQARLLTIERRAQMGLVDGDGELVGHLADDLRVVGVEARRLGRRDAQQADGLAARDQRRADEAAGPPVHQPLEHGHGGRAAFGQILDVPGAHRLHHRRRRQVADRDRQALGGRAVAVGHGDARDVLLEHQHGAPRIGDDLPQPRQRGARDGLGGFRGQDAAVDVLQRFQAMGPVAHLVLQVLAEVARAPHVTLDHGRQLADLVAGVHPQDRVVDLAGLHAPHGGG